MPRTRLDATHAWPKRPRASSARWVGRMERPEASKRGRRAFGRLLPVGDDAPRKAVYDIAVAELDRELRSAEALSARAATLIGFSGVILALASTLGRDSLTRNLGSVGRPVASYALIAGIGVVVVGAITAAAMLTPRQRGRLKPAVLRELRQARDAETDIYERLSKAAITLAAEEGAKNDRRGKLLRAASLAVVAGLLLIAAQAAVVASTLTRNPCTRNQTIETRTQTTSPPIRRRLLGKTMTTRAVTISSTGCAKATTKIPSAAEP